MNTLIVFVVGFTSAILYSRGKADPVQSLKVDAKRAGRWCRKTWEKSRQQPKP
ncbi:MAG: hypothetical protein JJU29_12755 [Verrucomicrobia bacterium]|nr:hypothetical protein [Verrucomicrobiota bacterium]MCH8512633.1 hypothetical protein [Kiritimatiellia bacterium]